MMDDSIDASEPECSHEDAYGPTWYGNVSYPSLDAAWAEAEAALPGYGWHLTGLGLVGDTWEAWAEGYENPGSTGLDSETGPGPTPAAALRALTAQLRNLPRKDAP